MGGVAMSGDGVKAGRFVVDGVAADSSAARGSTRDRKCVGHSCIREDSSQRLAAMRQTSNGERRCCGRYYDCRCCGRRQRKDNVKMNGSTTNGSASSGPTTDCK